MLGVFISKNEKLAKWSEISVIKLPNEHMFRFNLFGVFNENMINQRNRMISNSSKQSDTWYKVV